MEEEANDVRVFAGIVAAALSSGLLLPAAAADHRLRFEWCPAEPLYVGEEGALFFVQGLLETLEGDAARVRGWSVAVLVEGAEVVAEETFGDPGADPPIPSGIDIEVPLVLDHDGDPSTPPLDAGREKISSFGTIRPAELPGDPPRRGFVSEVAIDGGAGRTLPPGIAVRIFYACLRIRPGTRVSVEFADGLEGPEGPVTNRVETVSGPARPSVSGCAFTPVLDTRRFVLSVAPESEPELPAEGDFAVFEDALPSGRHRIPCLLYLASEGLPPGDGPQAWSLSVRHDPRLSVGSERRGTSRCLYFREDPFSGISVSTIFDHDGRPETPDLDPYEFQLSGAAFKTAFLGYQMGCGGPSDPSAPGIMAALVLHFTQRLSLRANAKHPIARVIYDVDVEPGPNPDLRIWYEDGVTAADGCSCPVDNAVTYLGQTFRPAETRGLILRLEGEGPWPGELFVRGDANADGRSDIGDPVAILGFLFLHEPESLPCRKAADADDSGRLDISDGVYLLNYRFLGGPAPAPPFPSCGHDLATPDDLSCEAFPACR